MERSLEIMWALTHYSILNPSSVNANCLGNYPENGRAAWRSQYASELKAKGPGLQSSLFFCLLLQLYLPHGGSVADLPRKLTAIQYCVHTTTVMVVQFLTIFCSPAENLLFFSKTFPRPDLDSLGSTPFL